MTDSFSRTRLLLGTDAMARLAAARVAVFGLGGVGGYAVEALARSGIGGLDLIDHDQISESNLNRQILATRQTIGRDKADVAKERVLAIHPGCDVTAVKTMFLPDTRDQFDFSRYDYVVDAIDTVTGKLALIEAAQAADVPIICAMGAGNKLDPTAFEVADVYQTTGCRLARIIRRECRRRGIESLKVVYSRELPRRHGDETPGEAPPEGRRDIPGSVAYVPSVMGLILAGEVIRDLTAR
ncbi:MAG: tRNA threonylcarbamoyladenosine dehydratase [Acutalibacteraceae bacterium]|jgi:tRNA A37 threonylcarbamoyladenosine dehydratase